MPSANPTASAAAARASAASSCPPSRAPPPPPGPSTASPWPPRSSNWPPSPGGGGAHTALPLFRKDGDLYAGIPLDLLALDSDLRTSATEVMAILVTREREGRLDERLTDKDIADDLDRSVSFVQKGLHTLAIKLKDAGKAIIIRTHARGRRTIEFVRGLRGSHPVPKADPPPAPPLHQEQRDKTTTAAASSSSLPPTRTDRRTGPGRRPGALPVRPATRRRRQLRGRPPGHDRLHRRVGPPGARLDGEPHPQARQRAKDWGFVIGNLRNKQRTGWPEDPPAPTPQATRPKAPPIEDTAAEATRQARLRGLWAALSEGQREEIRGRVKAENPGLARWPNLLESLYLEELERSQPAEEARAP